MQRIGIAIIFGILAASSNPLQAQSMWQHRHPSRVMMFRDVNARAVGDVLTIVVSESTDFDFRDERSMDKATQANGVFSFSGATAGSGAGRSGSADLNTTTTSNRDFDGSSEFTVERALSDRVTVTVLDVLPNGNLVVAGKKRHVVAGEARMLVVSGIVRPFDVGRDNTVQSRVVANLEVAYHGKGPESSFTNQGWLGRITNHIWPF